MTYDFGPRADGCSPYCTDRAGGEHADDCAPEEVEMTRTINATEMLDMLHGRRPFPSDETPDEVWCERCDAPSVTIVETQTGEHALCAKHAADLRYMLTCPGFKARD